MNHFRKLALGKAPAFLLLTGVLLVSNTLRAEESSHSLGPVLQNTTISGYVDTSVRWPVETAIPEPSLVATGASAIGCMLWMARNRRRRF